MDESDPVSVYATSVRQAVNLLLENEPIDIHGNIRKNLCVCVHSCDERGEFGKIVMHLRCSHHQKPTRKRTQRVATRRLGCCWTGKAYKTRDFGWRIVKWDSADKHTDMCGVVSVEKKAIGDSKGMSLIPKSAVDIATQMFSLGFVPKKKMFLTTKRIASRLYPEHTLNITYNEYYNKIARRFKGMVPKDLDASRVIATLKQERQTTGTDFRFKVGKLEFRSSSNLTVESVTFVEELGEERSEAPSWDIDTGGLKKSLDAVRTELQSAHLTGAQKVDLNDQMEMLERELDLEDDFDLKLLFVELKRGRNLWASAIENGRGLVLLDTTHGTNIFGFYLAFWAVIDVHGVTVPIAYSLQKRQDRASFAYLYKMFTCVFVKPPTSLMTDRDRAMQAALSVWPSVPHFWCTWHLQNNFKSALKTIFPPGTKSGKHESTALGEFWSICKEHDFSFRHLAKQRWDAMVSSVVSKSSVNATGKSRFRAWCDVVYKQKHKFLTCYTARSFTGGTFTSQRSESLHASFKQIDGSLCTFSELHKKISEWQYARTTAAAHREQRKQFQLSQRIEFTDERIIEAAESTQISAFARAILSAHVREMCLFKVSDSGREKVKIDK